MRVNHREQVEQLGRELSKALDHIATLEAALRDARTCLDEATEDTPDRPCRVVGLQTIDAALAQPVGGGS